MAREIDVHFVNYKTLDELQIGEEFYCGCEKCFALDDQIRLKKIGRQLVGDINGNLTNVDSNMMCFKAH